MFDYLKTAGADMYKGDRELIKRLSAQVNEMFNPCTIVQIGIAWGASVYCSRAGAPDATIYGVDIFGDDTLHGTDEQKKMLNLQVIREDSRTAWKEFDKQVHFLYVDGGHSYEVVSADIRNWESKVVGGGFAAFHDCIDCEVAKNINRALNDHMKPNRWEYLGLEGWSKYYRKK